MIKKSGEFEHVNLRASPREVPLRDAALITVPKIQNGRNQKRARQFETARAPAHNLQGSDRIYSCSNVYFSEI